MAGDARVRPDGTAVIPVLGKVATVRRLMRHHAERHGAPPARQAREMLSLWARNGIGPLEYYVLGLFRPALSWEEKRNMVSAAWYWKHIQAINPPSVRVVATNKLVSYGVLRAFGIETPEIHGVVHGVTGRTSDGRPLCRAGDLRTFAAGHTGKVLAFKPNSMWSGRGFFKVIFDDESTVRVLPDGAAMAVEALWNEHLGGDATYLIQEGVAQHPEVERFHPTSLNTMRAWLVRRDGGRWEMVLANLRMGVGGNVVDNTSAGGIGAPVDVATGRLGAAVMRGLDLEGGVAFEEHPAHPTTGVRIEGEQLPMWDAVKALSERACSAFPFFRLMGIDVAWGTEHPWVIEVEADPHSMIQAYCGRGLRPILDDLLRQARGSKRES